MPNSSRVILQELLEQWQWNHSEHCRDDWPHTEPCHWPMPPCLVALSNDEIVALRHAVGELEPYHLRYLA